MAHRQPFPLQTNEKRCRVPDLIALEFHGNPISTCRDELTQKVYCLPREIVTQLGVNWPGQHAKLTKSVLYQKHIRRMDIHTPGGNQEVLLLDIDYLPAWLASISPDKVQESIRERLLTYQEECAHVLRDYWTQGKAINPRAVDHPLLEHKAELALIDQFYALMTKLGQLTERDKLMVADQARNIMQTGQRLLPAAPEPPDRAIYGFSIAERVAQLGYHLTRKQQAALYPQLGKRIAAEWRTRYEGEPAKETRWVDGAQRPVAWYAQEEASWIDPILQSYLSQFPGLTRAEYLEET
jgi:P22_AR N-terminal domain